MPPKKKAAPTNPLTDRETDVSIAALKNLKVRPQVDFEAMAKDLDFKNKLSAKNAFFKIMKDKLANDLTKLPMAAPGNKSSPLKRGREQVEDGPIDAIRVKEPPVKRLNTMTLHKSVFDHDDEHEDGGVSLNNPPSHDVPVPSIEPKQQSTLDDPLGGWGLEHVAWPGMPANFSPSKHNNTPNIFDNMNEDDEVIHLFKGQRLKLNGPKYPGQQHFNSAQDEFSALRASDNEGDGGSSQSSDEDDSDVNSPQSSDEDDSDGNSPQSSGKDGSNGSSVYSSEEDDSDGD